MVYFLMMLSTQSSFMEDGNLLAQLCGSTAYLYIFLRPLPACLVPIHGINIRRQWSGRMVWDSGLY